MANGHPDPTGYWTLSRDACTLSAGESAVRSATRHIEHRDPVTSCSARFEFNDGTAFELMRERMATDAMQSIDLIRDNLDHGLARVEEGTPRCHLRVGLSVF